MGDFNISVDGLEASGMLEPLGLTLIRQEGTDITCALGKGSLIDDALVATRFAAGVTKVEAVETVPWDRATA